MKGPVSLLLLLFVFLLCGINAQIGFKTTLSQNGINYLKDVGMQILQGQLASLSIPDMNGRAETPVGHVSYSLTNIVLKGATIPGSSVTLTPPSSLSVAISNSQASMSLDWHYKEDSFPHVEDHGSADVTISSTSIGIVIQIGESNGHASGTASSCSVDIGVIKIDVHGGASWLYNWFISEFSGQIKSAAESALKSQIPTSVNQGLASAFNSMPIVEPINSKIELNYKLMSAPAVTSSYFTLSSLGEFYSIKDPQNAPFSPSSLPDIATTQMVQMFISDFTANSAAFVFFTEDVIHYTITDNMLPSNAPLRLNTTYFTELIPAFQKAYPNQMFSLFLYARDTPVTTFSSTGAQVMINGAIDFVMENKTTAFTLGLKVLTQGDAKLNGLNITADLTYVNTSLTLLNSTCGEFDVSVLQQIVGSLVIALLPSANKILEAGFPLPTITGLSFQNPTIGWGDGYMYVSTDATYTPKVTDEIISPTKIAVNVIN